MQRRIHLYIKHGIRKKDKYRTKKWSIRFDYTETEEHEIKIRLLFRTFPGFSF